MDQQGSLRLSFGGVLTYGGMTLVLGVMPSRIFTGWRYGGDDLKRMPEVFGDT
jgi:hypothetical protein